MSGFVSRIFFKLLFFFFFPVGTGGPTAPPIESTADSTPWEPSTGTTNAGKSGKSGCTF